MPLPTVRLILRLMVLVERQGHLTIERMRHWSSSIFMTTARSWGLRWQ